MGHAEKIKWMREWCAKNGLELKLEGECGFGRECVGVSVEDHYPDYEWTDDDTWERIDSNGEVWIPEDAYHKSPCVAVLGRGEDSESQLYEWLKWFDSNGFILEVGDAEMDPSLGMIGIMLGKHRYARMVKST